MLPFLILWPPLVVLTLMLVVHAFIVTGARAEAEVAASAGLRAAWRSVGAAGLGYSHDGAEHAGSDPNPRIAQVTEAVSDAVARTAAPGQGWRWWTPGAATVRSDWCHSGTAAGLRPAAAEPGWIRVEVSGEVFGPFSALWPGRLDRVHAVAAGPATLIPLTSVEAADELPAVPVELPAC